MQASRNESYVFLVRHAERTGSWEKEEEEYPIANRFVTPKSGTSEYWSTPGAPKAYALAGVLCDQLKKEKIVITHVIHSDHKIARQTADIFSEVLEKRQGSSLEPSCCEHLGAGDITTKETKQVVKKLRCSFEDSTTYLVVGHQPQLTQIAEKLVNRPLLGHSPPGKVLPLWGSEIACIHRSPLLKSIPLVKSTLLKWLITQKSDELLVELKNKIRSKYDVAKFFLGTLVVAIGLSLTGELWSGTDRVGVVFLGLGTVCAFLSLGLTAATLFSYDRLLMPSSFWSEGTSSTIRLLGTGRRKSVQRPPTQEHLLLFYEMIRIWRWQFLPAVGFAFAALGFFIISLAYGSVVEVAGNGSRGYLLAYLVIVCSVSFILPLGWYWWKRPKLGFPD